MRLTMDARPGAKRLGDRWTWLPAMALAAMALIAVMTPGPTRAETPEETRVAADAAYADSSWTDAEAGYEQVAAGTLDDGQVWFRLGMCRYQMGEYENAANAFARADGVGFYPPFSRYQLARSRARTGDVAAAVDMLRQAAEAGYANPAGLDDDAFRRVRSRNEFAAIAELVEKNGSPCESDERYRQFDFWLGSWDVFGPGGAKAGTNRIEKDLGGCRILESWTSASGGTGKSLNYYDPAIDGWRQVWVNRQGGNISAEGGLRDGSMVLEGKNVAPDGTYELCRMTYTPNPDGSVRQFIEQSKDEGETWYVWFDGRYVPRP